MPREIRFDFPLPHGLHARPASHLQELANRFTSKVEITNTRSNRVANAKSVLSMVSSDIRHGDACVIAIMGEDEERAESELRQFIRDVLPTCDDDETATPDAPQDAQPLPRSLIAAGLGQHYRGKPASGGIGTGKIVLMRGRSLLDVASADAPYDATRERARFDIASNVLRINLMLGVARSLHRAERGVLNAHLAILDDVAFITHVIDAIARDGRSASQAVRASAEHFVATLHASESAYLRERAIDVQDVAAQLLDRLAGRTATTANEITLTEPSIVVADRLTPSGFLSYDRNLLKGLVLREAGTTSHTIILARSMSVPTIVGVDAIAQLRAGAEAVVDATIGVIVTDLSDAVRRYYERALRTLATMRERVQRDASEPSPIALGANVSSAEEVELAIEHGRSDGIGLFRTEMLFLDRDAPPSEDEQFEIYARAARAAGEKPLVIRLLDIGGDKPAAYLKLPDEANPFLGYRGVRVYERHRTLIDSQIRAIARASELGDVRVLVPMISSVEEIRFARELVPRNLRIGAMIETPACAFMMNELAETCDFFSIGSNDLAQYFLAADRDNASVSHIYGWSHPSFLRMLSKIVARARNAGRHIGLCGEMADDPRAWPILLALKLDQISVPAPRVPTVRRAMRAMQASECDDLFQRVLACATRADADNILNAFRPAGATKPLLDRDLIIESRATNKHELIKEIGDAMWLADRASSSHRVEEAIWAREDTYSTGFGHGFALPHCKSDDVTANSIAIAKLSRPIEWGSNDGRPVDVVICVAMRASDYGKDHLRVFAQLSRMVMRDEFRDRVRDTRARDELLKFLSANLGLDQ